MRSYLSYKTVNSIYLQISLFCLYIYIVICIIHYTIVVYCETTGPYLELIYNLFYVFVDLNGYQIFNLKTYYYKCQTFMIKYYCAIIQPLTIPIAYNFVLIIAYIYTYRP